MKSAGKKPLVTGITSVPLNKTSAASGCKDSPTYNGEAQTLVSGQDRCSLYSTRGGLYQG